MKNRWNRRISAKALIISRLYVIVISSILPNSTNTRSLAVISIRRKCRLKSRIKRKMKKWRKSKSLKRSRKRNITRRIKRKNITRRIKRKRVNSKE